MSAERIEVIVFTYHIIPKGWQISHVQYGETVARLQLERKRVAR